MTVAPVFRNQVTLICDRETTPWAANIQGLGHYVDTGLLATTLIKQMRKVSRKQNLDIIPLSTMLESLLALLLKEDAIWCVCVFLKINGILFVLFFPQFNNIQTKSFLLLVRTSRVYFAKLLQPLVFPFKPAPMRSVFSVLIRKMFHYTSHLKCYKLLRNHLAIHIVLLSHFPTFYLNSQLFFIYFFCFPFWSLPLLLLLREIESKRGAIRSYWKDKIDFNQI